MQIIFFSLIRVGAKHMGATRHLLRLQQAMSTRVTLSTFSNFSHNSLIFNSYLLVRPFFLMHFDWIFVGKVEYTPKGLPSYKSFRMLKNTKSGRFECIHNKG